MSFFSYKKYKTIAHNTAYLSVLEVLKIIMPLVALPYIIKTVGVDNYGLVVFAQTIISYFIILVNFGLDISSVKDVSIYRDNKEKLSEIVSSVLIIKSMLFILALCCLLVLVLVVDSFRANALLFFLSFLVCIAEVLFPVWFYQGLEKMKYITYIRFLSILFYTVSVFLFIHTEGDYILIPVLQTIGWLISGVISFYLLIKVEKVTLFLPGIRLMRSYFMKSVPFFASRISVVFNASLAKTVCGFLFPISVVGAFDLAQKIATITFVPIQMLNQAVYPHIAKTQDRTFATKGLLFNLSMATVVVIGVYLLGPFAIRFLSDGALMSAVPILYALCFYIFCGCISLYTGTPLLVSFGFPKPFNISVILSSLVLVATYLGLYVTGHFTIISFAYALGLAEFAIAIYRLYFCHRYGIIRLKWLR